MTEENQLKAKGWVIFYLKIKTPSTPRRNEFVSEVEFKEAVEEYNKTIDQKSAMLRELSWVPIPKRWLGNSKLAVKADETKQIREKLEEYSDVVQYTVE